MTEMSDLEITKACAEKMGYEYVLNLRHEVQHWPTDNPMDVAVKYDPLNDDAQAMQLVKRFNLNVLRQGNRWTVLERRYGCGSTNLNHAICGYVAKMK